MQKPLPIALETELLKKQLTLLCLFSPVPLRAGIVVSVIIAWLLADATNMDAVLGWLATMVVVSIGRIWVQGHYSEHADQLDAHRWRKIILTSIALYGFLWAVPAICFMPSDPGKMTAFAVLIVGISATAIASLSSVRLAYALFILPFMLPVAIRSLLIDAYSHTITIGIFLHMVAMFGVARRHHLGVNELLRLQLDLQCQIEERQRVEAELRIAKAESDTANRAKTQFLANMSHELRTPLNGILGMAELLIRETSGKQLKYAQTVRNAGTRLLRIISDILDVSRMEAGALQISRVDFSPRALTSDAIELLLERASKSGIEVSTHVHSEVPECLASDAGRIQQILTNLVDNAIKFTERGSVRVSMSSRWLPSDSTGARAMARWEVRDTGIGIAPEARARLFKPFSQLDDSSTRRFGGAGLGLAISRQLVDALGGSIGVDSIVGDGATFWFEVPCDVVKVRAPMSVGSGSSPTRAPHVLVVEDNPINCELVAEMLQTAGCRVSTAADGEQALAALAAATFDLVLMDWHMPVMDGLTATRRLRALERAQRRVQVPVIALTASVLPGDREACEDAGMDGFVAKPFTYEQLVALIDRWVPREATD